MAKQNLPDGTRAAAARADLKTPRNNGTAINRPILIAGGGIGGLGTAIALAQHGISTHILEAREIFAEAGAGIQIGPNGMHVLHRLGLAQTLRSAAGIPIAINVMNAQNGMRLSRLPLGKWMEDRHGAPYWVLHRRDLHAALLQAATASEYIAITTRFDVRDVEDDGDSVRVVSAQGVQLSGAGLIGADGIWSRIRRCVFDAPPLRPSGNIAARAVVSGQDIGALFSGNKIGVWLSPNSHVVHYPVRGGRDIAVVLIVPEAALAAAAGVPHQPNGGGFNANWDTPHDAAQLLSRLGPLAPQLLDFLQIVPAWRSWTLFDPPALPAWSKGRVTLLGDAAHPVLPFLAQGAVMALEDALVLANAIVQQPANLQSAFETFAALRRQRILRVQKQSRRNGQIYHMKTPGAGARNLAMRLAGPQRLMSQYDWLYGWRERSE